MGGDDEGDVDAIDAKLGLDFGHPGDPLLAAFTIPDHIQKQIDEKKQKQEHHHHHHHHRGDQRGDHHHHSQPESEAHHSARDKLNKVLQAAAAISAMSTARTSVDSTPREQGTSSSAVASSKEQPVVPMLE